jgi:hypothetical protein
MYFAMCFCFVGIDGIAETDTVYFDNKIHLQPQGLGPFWPVPSVTFALSMSSSVSHLRDVFSACNSK